MLPTISRVIFFFFFFEVKSSSSKIYKLVAIYDRECLFQQQLLEER